MSLHTWKNDEQIRWDQIQPNLLVVNSQAENDGLQSLLEAASIDKVWLGLTDDDNVGIGEGNWTFLRDSSQVAFGNAPWLLNGSTDADPNFLRGTDIPDHLMDYAQLWTGAVGDTTNFWIQSHSGEGPLQATPGQWVHTTREGYTYHYDEDNNLIEDINLAHVILEFPATFCTPTFDFATNGDNGYAPISDGAPACPTTDVARVTLIELPKDALNDCDYPEADCEHCLRDRNELSQLPITYIGKTDSSKYYMTTSPISMEDLLSGEDYASDQLLEHFVRIGSQKKMSRSSSSCVSVGSARSTNFGSGSVTPVWKEPGKT